MKRTRSVLSVLLTLLLLAGCAAGGLSARTMDAIDQEETYPDGPYELAAVYHSVEELYEAAHLVLVGHVTEQTCTDPDGFPQTTSRLKVEQVVYGAYPAETVAVTEEGGTTSRGQVVYVGVPFMEQDQRYLLFLTKEDEQGRRFVVGAFQGKFILREGHLFQQAAQEVKLSREAYTPVPLEEFPMFQEK